MNVKSKIFFFLFTITFFSIKCTDHKKDKLKSLLPDFIKDSVYLNRENVFTPEKAELGRYLFYDRRLSINNTKACATCHAQQFSFTDGYSRSIGAFGDLHQRNTRPLINIIFEKYLTAADSSFRFPEQQINNPMFNDHPVEMGLRGNVDKILERIAADSFYRHQFNKVFPAVNNPVTVKNIQLSITSFIKTIFSFNSSYDDYFFRNRAKAMEQSSINGMQLFFSKQLHCSSCHGGINFNQPVLKDENEDGLFYFNTGLYNLNGNGNYPSYDQGLIELTKNPADMGKYRVPTLRNLAFTAPYFHDGSAATLEDVINVYENAGRLIDSGLYKGNGQTNPYKHPLVRGFKLNLQERKELVSFLLSLSDSSVLKNPAYANPFSSDETENN